MTLWIYVPKGMTVARVGASTKGNREVAVHQEVGGDSLMLRFQGQPDTVNWEAEFAGEPTR